MESTSEETDLIMGLTCSPAEGKPIMALFLYSFGGYEEIFLHDTKVWPPSQDDVVIQVKACGMNLEDSYVRQGIYTFRDRKPSFILGVEAAGVVSKVGNGVTEFHVGDRVLCWNFGYGMWSEYVKVHKSQCHLIPNQMNFMEANCVICDYVTAYLALMDFGHLRPGQSVLIQSATDSVGWAATQIAKAVGDVTIFGTASEEKLDDIKENGVTHPIDYRTKDFDSEVLRVSPTGVNVIIDTLSGLDFVKAQKCLKPLGRIVHIGLGSIISGQKRNLFKNLKVWWQTKNVRIYDLIVKSHAICGISISTIFENDPDAFKSALACVMKLYNDGKLKPRIDSSWSFSEVIAATKRMEERQNIGKIILVPKK